MSASPILTYGFGSYGSVELVPTLGFGIGEADFGLILYFSLSINTMVSCPMNINTSKTFNLSLAY